MTDSSLPSPQIEKIFWSGESFVDEVHQRLMALATESRAEYFLLARHGVPEPPPTVLASMIASGVDLAHGGRNALATDTFPDLHMVVQDWNMVRSSARRRRTNWMATGTMLLGRREMVCTIGGLDRAFGTVDAAVADMGYRAMSRGALVEYWPELLPASNEGERELSARETYVFLTRHYGPGWARYVHLRRMSRGSAWASERRMFRDARESCRRQLAPACTRNSVWYQLPGQPASSYPGVSVIVPTLGRYEYLPAALASLRRQTVRPAEVIVVDQNPEELRRPGTYEPFKDLNLKLIWQTEQGQSLARNTGLAEATGPYVLLFDDDSVADPDLIEAHMRSVFLTRFEISTGVAIAPGESRDLGPQPGQFPRVAQTFDTGNCLLSLEVAKKMKGLDRNYDKGPGTDGDFGTRLHLSGYRILHNPGAVRVHFKAPMGGLRVHGSVKYNTDRSVFAPFPPVTQAYYGLRYLAPSQRFERTLIQFLTSKWPREARTMALGRSILPIAKIAIRLPVLPFKVMRSFRAARAVFERGVRLADFSGDSAHR